MRRPLDGSQKPPAFIMSLRGVLLCLLASCLTVALPSHATVERGCERRLNTVGNWQEYRHDGFLIQYSLEGEHALKNPGDTLGDIPAIIRDIALQLAVMRDILIQSGFRDPLESRRYGTQGATHILVRVRNLGRLTGRAFDEVMRLPTGECVLIIDINSAYRSGNLTPAHEYFHLVQYGYTMFKRPWCLEGMARWAEDILGVRRIRSEALPETAAELEALFKRSYQAAPVWYALTEYCDESARYASVPDHVSPVAYSTGKPVVADSAVPGAAFIRRTLEAFDARDDRVSEREGLPAHHWPEKFQRDPSHDLEMWSTLADVCSKELPIGGKAL